MGYSETETQSNSRWISFAPAMWGVLSLGIGWKIVDSFLNPKTTYCGEAPDPTVGYVFAAGLGVFGFWQLWQSVAHSVAWSEDTVVVRDRVSRKTQVDFADLTNIEYGPNATIYIFGDTCVKVYDWVSGAKALEEKFRSVIRHYAPHLGYIPAFRGALDEAETAGCLRCSTLYAPNEVTSWKKDLDNEDLDIGRCLTCGTVEGLLFGVDGNVVTKEGLETWNKLLLETLDDQEKEDRLLEIKRGLEIASTRAASAT